MGRQVPRSRASCSLAMGIFLVFPVRAFVGAALAGGARRTRPRARRRTDRTFERTALSARPCRCCLRSISRRFRATARIPTLLFGFLLLIDVGLLAVALARRARAPARRSARWRRCSSSASGSRPSYTASGWRIGRSRSRSLFVGVLRWSRRSIADAPASASKARRYARLRRAAAAVRLPGARAASSRRPPRRWLLVRRAVRAPRGDCAGAPSPRARRPLLRRRILRGGRRGGRGPRHT